MDPSIQFKPSNRRFSWTMRDVKRWFLYFLVCLMCWYIFHLMVSLSDQQQISQQLSMVIRMDRRLLDQENLITTIKARNDKMIILVWTAAFSSDSWWGAINQQLNCDCLVTRDRSLIKQATVVLFYWWNTQLNDLPTKYHGQTWIWHHMESPINTHRVPHLIKFSRFIDCWSSYRKDSDFPFTYGQVVMLSGQNNATNLVKKPLTRPFKRKTKSIAWLVSNCGAPSGRDDYGRELSKYIDIDVYGKCGRYRCTGKDNCYKFLEAKYKFYLSFENSLCKDYYTEKLINVLNYNLIPIVFGGANYRAFLPNNSYIDALEFKSPKHLAMFLKKLAADEDRYNSYFQWKTSYRVIKPDYTDLFCQICSKIKSNDQKNICKRKYHNLIDWWFNGGQCKAWSPKGGLKKS